MSKKEILPIGYKSGMLTVIAPPYVDKKLNNIYKCRCECGKEKDVYGYRLRTQSVLSCGCVRQKKCSFCGGKHYAKGLCRNCYTRYRRNGDVKYTHIMQVDRYDLDGNFVKSYANVFEAAEDCGVHPQSIYANMVHKSNHVKTSVFLRPGDSIKKVVKSKRDLKRIYIQKIGNHKEHIVYSTSEALKLLNDVYGIKATRQGIAYALEGRLVSYKGFNWRAEYYCEETIQKG